VSFYVHTIPFTLLAWKQLFRPVSLATKLVIRWMVLRFLFLWVVLLIVMHPSTNENIDVEYLLSRNEEPLGQTTTYRKSKNIGVTIMPLWQTSYRPHNIVWDVVAQCWMDPGSISSRTSKREEIVLCLFTFILQTSINKRYELYYKYAW